MLDQTNIILTHTHRARGLLSIACCERGEARGRHVATPMRLCRSTCGSRAAWTLKIPRVLPGARSAFPGVCIIIIMMMIIIIVIFCCSKLNTEAVNTALISHSHQITCAGPSSPFAPVFSPQHQQTRVDHGASLWISPIYQANLQSAPATNSLLYLWLQETMVWEFCLF